MTRGQYNHVVSVCSIGRYAECSLLAERIQGRASRSKQYGYPAEQARNALAQAEKSQGVQVDSIFGKDRVGLLSGTTRRPAQILPSVGHMDILTLRGQVISVNTWIAMTHAYAASAIGSRNRV